jgi:hypothetical protein
MINIDKKYRPEYYNFRSKELVWFNTDSKETYLLNFKTRGDDLKLHGWLDAYFTYKFNSHGFRCEEFSDEPTLMALGCSNTFGVGMPIDKIWPEMLAKELNMKCANMGVCGGSLDSSFRVCHGYIDIVKPKIIIVLEPPPGRMQLFRVNNVPNNIGVWNTNTQDPNDPIESFAKLWLSNDNNHYFNREKNILAIEQMCVERNIKFIHEQYDVLYPGDPPGSELEPGVLARDLWHPGIIGHERLTKKLLSKYMSE